MVRLPAPPLGLVVVVCGLSTLGAEIATARLLAPAFGSSTVIWANTIAIVLVALAIGAWFGGRLADRGPGRTRMFQLILGGSALLALTPVIATPLLSVGVRALDDISAPGFFGSLVAVLLLVATPLTLLGAVTPYAVRLALGAVEDDGQDAVAKAGSIAGRLSALATGGSLIGTFLAALVLIPLVGTRRTFLIFALMLAVIALWGLVAAAREEGDDALASGDASDSAHAQKKASGESDTVQGRDRGAGTDTGAGNDGDAAVIGDGAVVTHGSNPSASSRGLALAAVVPMAILALIVLPAPTVKAAAGDLRLLEERETSEQYARVLESPDGTRTMELGEGHAVHSLRRPGTILTGLYWDELLVLPNLSGHAPKRILILGNAGGTIATSLRAIDPTVQVDAVDYDGQLTKLGRKWFGLGGPRLNVLTGDARVELRRSAGQYDAIIVDAYRQPYIPFHLSTKEFFTLTRERLAPGGVVIVNVGHPEQDDRLEKVLTATMKSAGLTHVLRDPAQTLNTQLVGRVEPINTDDLDASANDLASGRLDAVSTPGQPRAQTAVDRQVLAATTLDTRARLEPAFTGGPVYTDDKAPVELLIDESLLKVATGGS